MTPAELTKSLTGHLLVYAGRKIEGPYDVREDKSVVYVTTYDGVKLRVEVTRP